MVVRGVYTPREEEIVADFRERAEDLIGWVGDVTTDGDPCMVAHRVASRDLILQMAYAVDYWNPLWRDENYASKTRWGNIIAPPFFLERITHGGGQRVALNIPAGFDSEWWFPGTDWEFFMPVRENDSFKIWRSRPQLLDITNPDGEGPRKFRVVSSNIKYLNQRDEVVATFKRYFDETIIPENVTGFELYRHRYSFKRPGTTTPVSPMDPKQDVKIAPDYKYTREELDYIDHLADEEEIRGAKIRFWEDVALDEELRLVVTGPITLRDWAIEWGCTAGGLHNDTANPFVGSPASQSILGRLITNWMGDDGFIRKFLWRMLEHAHLGDTIIGRGKVIKKYVENGEHLVDLSLWTECLGEEQIPHAALATVRLLSKEDM